VDRKRRDRYRSDTGLSASYRLTEKSIGIVVFGTERSSDCQASNVGTFLVIGFTADNIAEGIGIAAPIARERPRLWLLVALAALAGLPAVLEPRSRIPLLTGFQVVSMILALRTRTEGVWVLPHGKLEPMYVYESVGGGAASSPGKSREESTVSEGDPSDTIFGDNHFDGFKMLMDACKTRPAITVAVAHPCDEASLTGALDAARAGLIIPILVGPEHKIRAVAEQNGLDLNSYTIVHVEHSHAAAARVVELVRAGQADALMKGSLHTDELLAEVVHPTTGLRTGRRISHCFVMDVPTYPKPLIVTDGAVNIAPDLKAKRDICQNAIDLARVLGIDQPKVAILSAVETVNPEIPSTIDAACLCKMADRGQITGGLLDGPLALDNAISLEAARTKDINSPVAGQADILLVPDLEAGNILAKQLTFLTRADAAGIVLGARVPIILTSRADSVRARMGSCALAVLLVHARHAALAEATS
jgi:phosphate acetyltransferase/phosphate butyryltransferase